MAKQTEHSKIIASTAKATLGPLGCCRVGQSRLWVSDERSWVIVVEFQPSGFSRGSYLNVAPMWLWREAEKGAWLFDYGRVRIARFVEFEDSEQFRAGAYMLARRAADEVRSLRQLFDTPLVIAKRLAEDAEGGALWPLYHAAVAAGPTGGLSSSLRLFTKVIQFRPDLATNCVLSLQNRSADLASKLSDLCEFRRTVAEIVQGTRANLNLRNDPDCLVGWRA